MKMIYGGTPVKNLNIVKHDVSTNDATVMPSDLQAGVSCYARGQKIVGTGKSFEFATYGGFETNCPLIISNVINVVEIASTIYPVKTTISLSEMKNIDFSTPQVIGNIIVDNVEYPVTATIEDIFLTFYCDKTVTLEIFFGKDNYV